MPLIAAKCTSCGANLEVDSTTDASICQFCGTAFIVEKAINNYKIANAQISANVVNVYKGNSEDFVIRAGVLEKYQGAETEVVIPDSVKSIGAGVFSGCTELTGVTIPKGVTSIGKRAFYECAGLTSMAIPDGVTSIEEETFYGCGGLTGIIIPNGVASIGKRAFGACRRLSEITIPDSVERMEAHAFSRCIGLTSVTMPDRFYREWQLIFGRSPAAEKLRRAQREEWVSAGRCGSCGSEDFIGLLAKKCAECGAIKE